MMIVCVMFSWRRRSFLQMSIMRWDMGNSSCIFSQNAIWKRERSSVVRCLSVGFIRKRDWYRQRILFLSLKKTALSKSWMPMYGNKQPYGFINGQKHILFCLYPSMCPVWILWKWMCTPIFRIWYANISWIPPGWKLRLQKVPMPEVKKSYIRLISSWIMDLLYWWMILEAGIPL